MTTNTTFRACLFLALAACNGQVSSDPNDGTDPAEKDGNPSESPSVHVVSVSGVSDCYGIGDTVDILVDYSAPVVVMGNPVIVLNALAENGKNIIATYDKEKSTNRQLRFTYTVNEGDSADASGYPAALTYSNENALQLNGASIRDENGNTASLKLVSPPASISDMLIDGIRPSIESVSSSSKNLGTTIFTRADMSVYVDVAYSEIVDFDASPTLALDGSRIALSDSSGGSSMLRFAYRVQPRDSAHSLLLEDNTPIIGDVYDTCGNVANSIMDESVFSAALRSPALIIETLQPVLETLTSSLPTGTYGIDSIMTLTATFSKSVILSSDATLKLLLNSGAQLTSAPGAPTTAQSFVFSYLVAAPQTTGANNLAVADVSLSPGGRLRDAVVPIVDADLSAIPSISSALNIDGIVPTVTSVSASGRYGFGQTIPININFSEPVRVMGAGDPPILNLTFNTTGSNANATYQSGTGTSVLTFNYVVGSNVAADPLACSSTTALLVPGKQIVDRAGNRADLNLPNPLTLAASFDARPLVTNVFSLTPNQTYRYNDTLQIGIAFAEPVNVTGIPKLTLTLNTSHTTPAANYVSSSNSSTLIFSYTIQVGDAATVVAYNGTAALALNGGTIRDGSNANAVLALPGGNPLTGSIDAVPVAVASVSASGSYGFDQPVPVSVRFAKAITVTGRPQLSLTLTTSQTARTANFASKSDASTMVFNYVVQASDRSPLDVLALNLNGGTIVDPSNNNNPVALALAGKSISAVIEASTLMASSVSTTFASGTYGTLQNPLPITINFNRNIKATAAGTLTLTAGVNNRSVPYAATGSFANTLALNYTISTSDDKMAFNPYSLTSVSTAWVDEYGNSLLNPTNFSAWAGSKTIVLDGKVPTITGVSASPLGTFGIGQVITVTLTFSEPVTSTGGNLLLTLSVGGVLKTVTTTVTNSTQVVFNYTIAAGDMGAIAIATGTALSLGAGVTLGDYDGAQSRRLNNANLFIDFNFSGVAANTRPQAPTGLTAYSQATAGAYSGLVNLAWTAPADSNRWAFVVWYSSTVDLSGVNPTDGNLPTSPPAGILARTTTAVSDLIGSLAARAPYRFKVWAYNYPAYLYSSAGTNVAYDKPRNWNYNAYLKAINSVGADYLGGGLSANGGDGTGARGVDIASWQYPTDTWMFAVAGAAGSELELTGIENSDSSYLAGNRQDSGNAGAVYVYKRNTAPGQVWTHDAILHPHCQVSDARRFGFSVAMSNKTIVVGEPFSNLKASSGYITNGASNFNVGCSGWAKTDSNRGGVFIYEQDASNGSEADWTQTAFIRAGVFGTDDSDFGWSVALSGNTLVVGATNAYGDDGAALMYTRSGSSWGSELQLYEPDANNNPGDRFGFSVAVDESTATAVVGAPWEDGGCGSHSTAGAGCANNSLGDSGAVFVYATGDGTSKNYLKASNAGASDLFGFSVAISSDTIVVGAPGEDSGITTITLGAYSGGNDISQDNRGAAYVFKRSGTNWIQEAVLKAPLSTLNGITRAGDLDGFDQFGWSVDIAGDTIIVGALYEDRYTGQIFNGESTNNGTDYALKNSGAAYVFRRTGTSWYRDAYLKPLLAGNEVNTREIRFGSAVAVDPATQAVIVAAPLDNYNRTDSVYSFTVPVGSTSMYFWTDQPAPLNRAMNENSDDSGAVYIFTP